MAAVLDIAAGIAGGGGSTDERRGLPPSGMIDVARRRRTTVCELCAFENESGTPRCAMCGASLSQKRTEAPTATKDMLWLLHEAQRRGGSREVAVQALSQAGARAQAGELRAAGFSVASRSATPVDPIALARAGGRRRVDRLLLQLSDEELPEADRLAIRHQLSQHGLPIDSMLTEFRRSLLTSTAAITAAESGETASAGTASKATEAADDPAEDPAEDSDDSAVREEAQKGQLSEPAAGVGEHEGEVDPLDPDAGLEDDNWEGAGGGAEGEPASAEGSDTTAATKHSLVGDKGDTDAAAAAALPPAASVLPQARIVQLVERRRAATEGLGGHAAVMELRRLAGVPLGLEWGDTAGGIGAAESDSGSESTSKPKKGAAGGTDPELRQLARMQLQEAGLLVDPVEAAVAAVVRGTAAAEAAEDEEATAAELEAAAAAGVGVGGVRDLGLVYGREGGGSSDARVARAAREAVLRAGGGIGGFSSGSKGGEAAAGGGGGGGGGGNSSGSGSGSALAELRDDTFVSPEASAMLDRMMKGEAVSREEYLKTVGAGVDVDGNGWSEEQLEAASVLLGGREEVDGQVQAYLLGSGKEARERARATLAEVGLDVEKLGRSQQEAVVQAAIGAWGEGEGKGEAAGGGGGAPGAAMSYWDAAKLIRSAGLELECFVPPPWEQKELDKLSTRQRAAIGHVANDARIKSHDAMQLIERRVRMLGFRRKHMNALFRYIRDEAPIIIHLNLGSVLRFLERDSHYRNQFETSLSGGCMNLQARRSWEDRLFDGLYEDAKPKDRVKYGVLNVLGDPRGVASCIGYGASYFELRNVRLRSTMCDCDSSSPSATVATCEYYAHVLASFTKDELRTAIKVATGKASGASSTCLRTSAYKEIQVHGQVRLSKHVKALHATDFYRRDPAMAGRIREFCDRNGIDLVWIQGGPEERF